LGEGAGAWLSRLTGQGKYKVTMNSIMDPASYSNSSARFQQGGKDVNIIRHRELVGVVTGTKDFTITKYPINPAYPKTFPWLSPIANNYEEYEFRGLVFEYETTSSDYSASVGLGNIIFATNYDAADPDFFGEVQMSSYEFSTQTKPSANMLHPVECDPRQKVIQRNFTRNNDLVLSSSSVQFYDFGNFYVATVGQPPDAEGVVLGRLYVTYDVALARPRVPLISNVASTTTWYVDASRAVNFHDPLQYMDPTVTDVTIGYDTSLQQFGIHPIKLISYDAATHRVVLAFPLPGLWKLDVFGELDVVKDSAALSAITFGENLEINPSSLLPGGAFLLGPYVNVLYNGATLDAAGAALIDNVNDTKHGPCATLVVLVTGSGYGTKNQVTLQWSSEVSASAVAMLAAYDTFMLSRLALPVA
jgi:hypothetical protein